MSGKVTLGQGSPYHLGRLTLLVGLAVCLQKPRKSSSLGRVTLGGHSFSTYAQRGKGVKQKRTPCIQGRGCLQVEVRTQTRPFFARVL